MSNLKYFSMRPHHILCTFNFLGAGYSDKFISNFWNIKKNLKQDTQIRIVSHTDSICNACPHARGSDCIKESKIQSIDKKHSIAFNLTNQTISWSEAINKIHSNITQEVFDNICSSCQWKSYKICERNLKEKVWRNSVRFLK